MANNYDKILELANANNMGLSNTIKRDFGIPLDYTSVQASYEAALTYAATNTLAYVGQPISVGDKLYIVTAESQGKYPAEVQEGQSQIDIFLAEVGSATEGDGSTIDLKDGVLSLHGIDGKLTGTYVPSLVNGVLTWNAPDNTTIDGLTASIDALELRADNLEATVGKEAEGNSEATGLIKAINDIQSSLPTKLSDLENDINAASKDYVDNHLPAGYNITKHELDGSLQSIELGLGGGGFTFTPDNLSVSTNGATGSFNIKIDNDAPATLTLSGYSENHPLTVTAGGSTKNVAFYGDAISNFNNDVGYQTADDVSNAIANKADKATTLAGYGITDAYTQTQVNDLIAGITHFTTEVVSSVDAVTEVGVLYLIKDDTVSGADKYNEYLFIEGLGATLIGDTTTDLTNYVTNDALATELAKYTTTEGLTTVLAPYAKTSDVNTELAKKVNIETYTADKATFALEESVASRLANKADTVALDNYYTSEQIDAKGYAVANDVNAELAKKVETAQLRHTSEGVGEGVTKDGTALTITVDAYRKSEVYTKSETDNQIDAKIASVTGGESAADVKLALESYRDAINVEMWGADAANWTTRTSGENGKVTVTYTPQYGATSRVDTLESDVATLKTNVQKAQADATAAGTAVSTLESGKVATNAANIATIQGQITGEGGLSSRIGAVEAANTAHATEYANLKAKVDTAVDTTIPALTNRVAANEASIVTINNTLNGVEDTEGLIATVAKKADAANVYTKGEVDAKVITSGEVVRGTADSVSIASNKITVTLNSYTKGEVDSAISTAIGNIDNTAITNNSADIAVLVGTDKGEDGRANKSIRTIAADEINTLIKAADPEGGKTIENINNLIAYVDQNAGDIAELITATDANTAKLAGIETTVVAAIQAAKEEAIAAIPALEVATAETLGGVKSATGDNKVSVAADGVMSVSAVNVNTLTQTTGDVLILNGGSASI